MTNVYDPDKGFCSGNGFDWEQMLITKPKQKKQNKEELYNLLFEYCLTLDCTNFSALCSYARSIGALGIVLGRAYAFKQILEEQKVAKTCASYDISDRISQELYKKYKSDPTFVSDKLRQITGYSTMQGDLWDWACEKLAPIILAEKFSPTSVRRSFSSMIDQYRLAPRKAFEQEFFDWKLNNDRGVSF